jgi:hypothetical protein
MEGNERTKYRFLSQRRLHKNIMLACATLVLNHAPVYVQSKKSQNQSIFPGGYHASPCLLEINQGHLPKEKGE